MFSLSLVRLFYLQLMLRILSAIENKSFSPSLQPIAMYAPSGSNLFVKPGDGRIDEKFKLQELFSEQLTFGVGVSISYSIILLALLFKYINNIFLI